MLVSTTARPGPGCFQSSSPSALSSAALVQLSRKTADSHMRASCDEASALWDSIDDFTGNVARPNAVCSPLQQSERHWIHLCPLGSRLHQTVSIRVSVDHRWLVRVVRSVSVCWFSHLSGFYLGDPAGGQECLDLERHESIP